MLLGTKSLERFDRFNRRFTYDVFCLRCDTCGREWETRGSKVRIMQRKTHSCSANCKSNAHKTGGAADVHRASTCLERYGAANPFAAEQCKEKMRVTWREKYGVDHGPSSPMIRDKAMATMRSRYGERPQTATQIVERRIETMRQNWGVDYPMQLAHVKEAMMSGSIVKYGVPFPMQSVEFQKHVFEQRDGISWMSKPEKAFRLLLEETYGKKNVKVQRLLERKWSVDFYVVPIDTWVSFDGVYWHGLDRPIEWISESTKPRDKVIYGKWLKDRELDEHMRSHNMRLVRITDREFKLDPVACLCRIAA